MSRVLLVAAVSSGLLVIGGAARADDEREVEAEMRRFGEASQDFQRTVDHIVRLEYQRRRRDVDRAYRQKIAAAEREEKLRRADAIALFERFLVRHPGDPVATPDVLYRLAERYFERDREAFLAALDAAEAAGTPPPLTPDHAASIALYRDLVARFPAYRHLDGALYLLGYCEEQMGHGEAARAAWVALVCPAGDATSYRACAAARPGSRHLAETWLRLGDHHFDLNQLGPATAAYEHVLDGGGPDSHWYDKALYKLAWTHYRADRLPEAVARFDQLVALQGPFDKAQGRPSGELRHEALQYLGICFAEPVWNGVRDEAGVGLPRIDAFYRQRSTTPPPHARDVYEHLGDVLFEETDYARAAQVYRAILERWPLHARNPKVQDRVILALERGRDQSLLHERERAVARFATLGAWWNANRDDDQAIAAAQALLESNAARAAIEHHRVAQQLRLQGRANVAGLEYRAAAAGYRAYLEAFPMARNAVETRFLLAEALFYGDRFAEAAREYEAVRDGGGGDPQQREQSAFYAVKAHEKQIEVEVAAGRLRLPDLPSVESARKTPVTRGDLAPPVAALQEACDVYVATLPRGQHAAALAYKAAEIEFRHGRFAEAKTRLAAFIERHCQAPHNLALVAEEALMTTLAIEKDLDGIARWVARLDGMSCGVGAARQEAQARRAQLAADVGFFAAEARFSAGDLDGAAGAFLAIAHAPPSPSASSVNGVNDHRAEAFFNAALSHEKLHRSLVAVRIFERLADELPEVRLVDEALFHAAQGHERLHDRGAALGLYRRLADSPRHVRSKLRAPALHRASLLVEYEQRYAEAALLEARAVQVSDGPPAERAEGLRRAAELHRRAGDDRAAVRELRAALALHPGDLRARRELAEALETQDRRAALALHREVAARAPSVKAASEEAEQVAASQFWVAEERLAGLERQTVSDGELKRFEAELHSLDGSYAQVMAQKRAGWTLAAYFRQGHLRQLHASALARLLTAPCPSKVRARYGDEGCQVWSEQLQRTVAPEVSRLEREAVDRYRVTLEQAARLQVTNRWTAQARGQASDLDPAQFPRLHDERVALSVDAPLHS